MQRANLRDKKARKRNKKKVARTEARRIARESLTPKEAEPARLREEKRALREVKATGSKGAAYLTLTVKRNTSRS